MLLFEITLYSLFREGKKATNETQNLQLNRPEKGGGKKKPKTRQNDHYIQFCYLFLSLFVHYFSIH